MKLSDAIKAMAVAAAIAVFCVSASGANVQMQNDTPELQLSLHEPVVARVTLINRTNRTVSADFGLDFIENFRLIVTGPDGQRRLLPPFPLKDGMAFRGQVEIAPSASYTRPVILNEWLGFTTPGVYIVEVSLTGIANTAIVRVTILPRDVSRLSKSCKELAQNALKASDFKDALHFARALSFSVDSEAVPYLKKVAEENDGLVPTALEGLTRIADRAAVGALHALSVNPSRIWPRWHAGAWE